MLAASVRLPAVRVSRCRVAPGLVEPPLAVWSVDPHNQPVGVPFREEDILDGYNRGADDYILKPFSFPVLLAKLKAVMKRYEGVAEKTEKKPAKTMP